MRKSAKHQAILSLITVFIFGCYNAPTPPSEIEGAHISGLHYEKFDCQTLNDEINFLEKREKELVIAQEERIKEVILNIGGLMVLVRVMESRHQN